MEQSGLGSRRPPDTAAERDISGTSPIYRRSHGIVFSQGMAQDGCRDFLAMDFMKLAIVFDQVALLDWSCGGRTRTPGARMKIPRAKQRIPLTVSDKAHVRERFSMHLPFGPTEVPADLALIIDPRPSLPEAIRAGILAMVKATLKMGSVDPRAGF
jgi:hypothetical protein